jgi:hypothetical protein
VRDCRFLESLSELEWIQQGWVLPAGDETGGAAIAPQAVVQAGKRLSGSQRVSLAAGQGHRCLEQVSIDGDLEAATLQLSQTVGNG